MQENTGGIFIYMRKKFFMKVATVVMAVVVALGLFLTNILTKTDAGTKTQTKWMPTGTETVTLPAGNFGFYSDIDMDTLKNTGIDTTNLVKFEQYSKDENGKNIVNVTKSIDMSNYYNNFGYETISFSPFSFTFNGGGNIANSYDNAESDQTYVKTTINLHELFGSYFNEDGTHTFTYSTYNYKLDEDGNIVSKETLEYTHDVVFNVRTAYDDGTTAAGYLAIVSDSVVNVVTPDENGNVTVYVNQETGHMDYVTDFRYTIGITHGGGGGHTASPYRNIYILTEYETETEIESTTEAEATTKNEPTTEAEATTKNEPTTEAETTIAGEVAADEEIVIAEVVTENETVLAGEVAADNTSVQTGDTANIKLYVIILIFAVVCIIAGIITTIIRRKNDK